MSKVANIIKGLDMTKATRLVLPMLYLKDRNDKFFITENFNNCYIGDGNHPELGSKIFLLYEYQMTIEYVKFERKMELASEFSTDTDYSDERQVMYVLNIPDEHAEDFKHFLKGEYTQFSPELKLKIFKFWCIKEDKDSSLYSILYAKDAEGEKWSKPDLAKEIYMNPN